MKNAIEWQLKLKFCEKQYFGEVGYLYLSNLGKSAQQLKHVQPSVHAYDWNQQNSGLFYNEHFKLIIF